MLFQRFIEIWSALPHLYILIIISSVIAPSVLVLLGIMLLLAVMGNLFVRKIITRRR